LILVPARSQAPLLHSLRARYARDGIYTFVGSILVALNPFKVGSRFVART
jgi:myosin heavy subunit